MIQKYLNDNRENIISTVKKLVSIPSVRGRAEKNAPYGIECARMLDAVKALYDENGFITKINHEDGYLLSYLNENADEAIGLFAHSDVVPVGNDWEYTEPFTAIERDGFLFGRGVKDNISGIIVSLYAAKAIRELKLPFDKKLVLFTGSCEETGMEDVIAFSEKESMPDICIVPDTSFPVIRGEAGILHFWATAPEARGELISFEGGDAFNIVLGEAKAVLKYDKSLYDSISASNDGLAEVSCDGETIVITSKGIPKHAGSAEGSVNAAYKIVKLLLCSSVSDNLKSVLREAEKFLVSPMGEGFGIEGVDPDFSALVCANGMVRYENGALKLSFDVRYGATISPDALETSICKSLKEKGWSFCVDMHDYGFVHSADSPLIKRIENAYKRITGDSEAKALTTRGGTYARHLKNAVSIGTEVAKKRPFDFPAGHGGVHQADECISIDGLLEAIRIVTEMLISE